MSNGGLELSDEEFWGDDVTRTRRAVLGRLQGQGFLGLLLDGPARVPMGSRDRVPLAGWHVRTLREDRTLDRESQMLVAALDLDTDDLRVGLALDTGKPRTEAPPLPETDPGEGCISDMFAFDLRETLTLPWRPGRWRAAVVLRDRISNAVTIGIEATDAAAPARPAGAAVAPAPVWPPPVGPGVPRDVPSYRQRQQSPPVPPAAGIALTVPRVVLLRERATAVLRGSFRLPLRRWNRVLPDARGARPEVGDPNATGIVPITLVLTGSEVAAPFVFRLRVPAYDDYDREAEAPLVTGYLNLDLHELPNAPRRPMTYFAYAFGGGTIAGPVPIGLVTEDMIRP